MLLLKSLLHKGYQNIIFEKYQNSFRNCFEVKFLLIFQNVEAERKSREEHHRACIETSQDVRLAREREQKASREYQVSYCIMLGLKTYFIWLV